MPYEKEKVSRRIASLRIDKGWSQEDLAKECGVSANSIARYETGSTVMSLDVAYRITEALDCSLDKLVCRTD